MGVTIGSNIASLMAQRQLGKSSDALSKSSERLASGMRINRASDDAAGLSIATSLNSSARVYAQGIRNINDGISALSIAEGALGELSGITTRLMELAEQSANGTFGLKQRKSMASEADQLTLEYNRIISTTKFNGINLLDPATGDLRIQAGYGVEGSITVQPTTSLSRTVGDGTFGSAVSFVDAFRGMTVIDINGDGKLDVITGPDATTASGAVFLGNNDGSFQAAVSYAAGLAQGGFYSTVLTSDYNNDGKTDVILDNTADSTISVLFGNGDGTFKAQYSYSLGGAAGLSLVQGDYNSDGITDIAATTNSANELRILFGNSNGSFKASVSITTPSSTYSLASADIDGDGILDLVSGRSILHVLKGNGDGTFKRLNSPTANSTLTTWIDLYDYNRDGLLDMVTADPSGGGGTTFSIYIGNGDGSFGASTSYYVGSGPYTIAHNDINGDGLEDMFVKQTGSNAQVFLGNGDGTFSYGSANSGVNGFTVKLADLNSDGVLDLAGGGSQLLVAIGNTRSATTLQFIDLLSQSSARNSLTLLQANLSRINLQQGAIGAAQSRFSVASSVLQASNENYKAGESRIMDVDVAEEAANYARIQILQQASSSILAQANQLPALALQLLR